ncbi:MAG: DUF4270 family protein [Bacteroidota bacterium]
MKNRRLVGRILNLALPLIIGYTLSSCNQEGTLGLDLLPDKDLYPTVTDSITLVGGTVPEDSLQSQLPGSFLLGELNNPAFGRARASFAFQILPGSENIRLGDPDSTLTLDSLVFSMSLAGYQGDTNTSLKLRVHRLAGTITPNRTYYSRDPVRTYGEVLGESIYRYRSGAIEPVSEPVGQNLDSVIKYSGIIRFRLDQTPAGDALAQSLLRGKDSVEYKDAASFVRFVNGLWVEAQTDPLQLRNGPGLLLQSSPVATRTGLYLYYKNGTQRRRLDLMLRTVSGSRNRFEFDLQNSEVKKALGRNSGTDTTLEFTYVQAGSGVKTRLSADSLYHALRRQLGVGDSLSLPVSSGWVIHKATLEFVNADTGGFFGVAPPTQLFLVPLDSQGRNMASLMPDLFESYYDGNLRNGRYRFGITRYLQQLLAEGPRGRDLAVIPVNPVGNLAMVRLRVRPRLRVTYTRIP